MCNIAQSTEFWLYFILVAAGGPRYDFIIKQLGESNQKALQNGETLGLKLNADRRERDEVPTADRDQIDRSARNIAPNTEVGMYMDLNFYWNLGGRSNESIRDLGGHMLDVGFVVPQEFAAPANVERTYHIIRLHDGIADVLYSSKDMEFVFRTDRFSTYALAYTDVMNGNTDTPTGSVTNSDKQDESVISSAKSSDSTSSSNAPVQYSQSEKGSSSSSSSPSSDTHKAGKGEYKANYTITGKKTVRYEEAALGHKKKSAKVPDTVTIDKKTYKVTSISSYAFVGYDKLTSVVIGKNVKMIGKQAFDGCSSLKTLTVITKKLKAKNIKSSLSGASVKTVNVPDTKLTAYKKIFKAKITGNKGRMTVKSKKK